MHDARAVRKLKTQVFTLAADDMLAFEGLEVEFVEKPSKGKRGKLVVRSPHGVRITRSAKKASSS